MWRSGGVANGDFRGEDVAGILKFDLQSTPTKGREMWN